MSSSGSTESTPATPPTPEKISEAAWDVIYEVEQFWHEKRFFPSNEVISEKTGIPVSEVSELVLSREVQRRLENRGIDFRASPPDSPKSSRNSNPGKLSDKQLAVAMTILNVSDSRPLSRKLESLGVASATYHGWTKSKAFQEFMSTQMEDMFGAAMPLAHQALIAKVVSGDFKSIKLFYEMTGKYGGKSEGTENVRMLVIRIIEILQFRIKDPELLATIAEDLRALSPISNPLGGGNAGHSETRAELAAGI